MKNHILIFLTIALFVGCEPENDQNSEPAQWKVVNANTTNTITKAAFINDSIGYIGVAENYDYLFCDYYGDINDWIDWSSERLSPSDSHTYNFRRLIKDQPVDQNPEILKTTDGGNTWEELNNPFITGVTDLCFIDENYGFAATSGEGVFKTENSGKSWKTILANVIFPGENVILTDPYSNIYFKDKLNGFAFSNRQPLLIYTNDGGETWDYIFSEFSDQNSDIRCTIKKIVFPEKKQTGYFICNYEGKIGKTIDGGKTWKIVLTSDNFELIDDISFIDDNTGMYLSDKGIFKTSDGGESWQQMNDNISIYSQYFDKIIWVNSSEVFVLVPQKPENNNRELSVFYSSDGGNSYTEMSIDKNLQSNFSIYDFVITTNKTGLAVGSNGIFLKYSKSN